MDGLLDDGAAHGGLLGVRTGLCEERVLGRRLITRLEGDPGHLDCADRVSSDAVPGRPLAAGKRAARAAGVEAALSAPPGRLGGLSDRPPIAELGRFTALTCDDPPRRP
ncbi:hypothetical protein GCM10010442_28980 [Kitasatospora kifunensis]